MTSFAVATHFAPLAARYQPAAANGRTKKMIAAGRVIQVGLGKRGTVRMTVDEARDFAVGLLEMAGPLLPGQVLVVKWKSPGARYPRDKRVTAGEVLPFAAAVLRACKEAEQGTLFQGVRG